MEPADIAEIIAGHLEATADFQVVDWNDLGEVTVQKDGHTFRMTVYDITNEE